MIATQHIASSDVGPVIIEQLWFIAMLFVISGVVILKSPDTWKVFFGLVSFIPTLPVLGTNMLTLLPPEAVTFKVPCTVNV